MIWRRVPNSNNTRFVASNLQQNEENINIEYNQVNKLYNKGFDYKINVKNKMLPQFSVI